MRAGAPARVAVIVVNYNGGPELATRLERFAASVAAIPTAKLIVVDNASTDGSRQVVLDFCRASGAIALPNEQNLGYAAAINHASAAADAAYVACCNMDVLVENDWLPPLLAWLDAHPSTAAVNPLILLPDGLRVNAFGQSIHLTGLGFNRELGTPVSRVASSPAAIDGLQGAAFVVRASALEEIGGIPDDGFLYHEDVHLSLRLRLAGYRLDCVPDSRVRHDYALSMYAGKFHLLERNRLITLLTCFKGATLLALAPLLLLTELLAWGFAILRGADFISAKWRACAAVVARRKEIRAAHLEAAKSRRMGDFALLRTLAWRYQWRQFATLARERGKARPAQALP